MKYPFFRRLSAGALALSLLTLPAAQALTTEQAAGLLQEVYVDEIPQSVLEQPTVEAMLEALGDPYTEYFTAEEYSYFTSSMTDTSLVGVGIAFTITDEGLLISEVLKDSPAQAGELQAGDLILSVDGRSVLGQERDTLTGWLQGEEGTQVKLTYQREGRKKTVTLTRALVVIPATTGELIDDYIGYISCTTFGPETVGHFKQIIADYGDQATTWIVDLRSNTGGHTDAATDAAGLFTGPGLMAYLRDGADEYSAFYSEEASATIYPVIVLVDQYTASASEIFASAIQDRGAGIVVGTRTFGKGVAQVVMDENSMPDYFPDGDALKITAYRFFSPAGNTCDQVGVIPDLLLPEDQIADVATLLAGSDPMGDNKNTLRVDLGWQWFVDLSLAQDPEWKEAFQTLLDAIPDNKKVWLGAGSARWTPSSVEEAAEKAGLTYNAPLFPDHDDSDYLTPLSVLKTYDMIHGKDDGNFHPQDTLTRGELCQLLAVALNCTIPDQKSPFTDVAEDAWYKPAITALSSMGLVNGVGNNLFRPEDPIDHQQFITIMARLAQKLNFYFYDTMTQTPAANMEVVGVSDYADWAKPSAWLLSFSQHNYFGEFITYLWASAEKIDPTAATTRDEAICTLYKILSYPEVLPA